MTETRLNLSGQWTGNFSYPLGQGTVTPFMARLEEVGGQLSGTTIEPNMVGASSWELQAFVRGTRDGRAVDFIKTYDGASDAAHSVDYVGRLSEDANRVSGVWSLEDMDGTFEMERDATLEEAKGEEVEAVELVADPALGESGPVRRGF